MVVLGAGHAGVACAHKAAELGKKVVLVEKQAEELGEVTVHRTLVKVSPMEDGRWYCPDCGELNGKSVLTCKGCGRDFT